MKRWQLGAAAGAGVAVLIYLLWPVPYCRSAERRYGVKLPHCPDGSVRQTLSIRAWSLKRGGEGSVRLGAKIHYAVAGMDTSLQGIIPELEAALFLVDHNGVERAISATQGPLQARRKAKRGFGYLQLPVALPRDLADGDYLLRAKIETTVAKGVVDLRLPIYAPAQIHVLTDRPLYEAGQRIQFRALALRARDLHPLDNRPGRWVIKDPSGEIMLEEKAALGAWGVASGDFLLDGEASTGDWTVSWQSSGDSGSTQVRVEPFTLPRFRIQATAGKPFYRAGDTPLVRGQVIYSSGAPVAGAKLMLRWSVNGSWPPPLNWVKKVLPQEAVADHLGRFKLTLPTVPRDLQGKASLNAQIIAVDPAGDRVHGGARVLLAEDAIGVISQTSFKDGLVGGFNNRLYFRITTADGRPLPGAKIAVKRAWANDEPAIMTELDQDSVGRIQIDPGAPVNMIIPAKPWRKRVYKRKIVRRQRAHDLLHNRQVGLDDLVELDRWAALIAPCAKLRSSGHTSAELAIRVNARGAIVNAMAHSAIARCVISKIKGRRFTAASERMYALRFAFSEPLLPSLHLDVEQGVGHAPGNLLTLFSAAARDARDCLPTGPRRRLPRALGYTLKSGSVKPTLAWVGSPRGRTRLFTRAEACIMARLRSGKLAEAPSESAMGVVRYRLQQPSRPRAQRRPRPTVRKGYELVVSASLNDKPLGKTTLRIGPGTIPALTLRAEPVLAQAGSTITLKFLRGPSYRGRIPRIIRVSHQGKTRRIKLKRDARTVRHTLRSGQHGWFTFESGGQRALVFVPKTKHLTVSVKSEKSTYAPGSTAKLLVQTQWGQKGTQAAVGLFGVDSSLEQLAKLPDADALNALQPKVEMHSKAFALLDGQALALGRIQGPYAAEATVLRVGTIPAPAALDRVIQGSAKTTFSPVAHLVDRFYSVLSELHRKVRVWERQAPKGETMKPATMAKLWNQALDAAESKGLSVKDAFDRRMTLHRLPPDLLMLASPREVVADGLRLSEDVENWAQWVARRRPR